MRSFLFLLLFLPTLSSEELPWSDMWSMPLEGVERDYVDYKENSYLCVKKKDYKNKKFLVGKEVMLEVKYDRIENGLVYHFGVPPIFVDNYTHLWSGLTFGDNLYIIGKINKFRQNKIEMQVLFVMKALSDEDIIKEAFDKINKTDFEKRIVYAKKVRTDGLQQGNKAFWFEMSEKLFTTIIEDIAGSAKKSKSVDLLLKAIILAKQNKMPSIILSELAGRKWINELGADSIRKVSGFMSKNGFIKYKKEWLLRIDALLKEYEDKLKLVKNGNDYFELSNWIDVNGDILPKASFLRNAVLSEGISRYPNHNGIRMALGMETIESNEEKLTPIYVSKTAGLTIHGPKSWSRSRSTIDGEATWINPVNQTVFVSVSISEESVSSIELALESAMSRFFVKENYSVSADHVQIKKSASNSFVYTQGIDERYGMVTAFETLNNKNEKVIVTAYFSSLNREVSEQIKIFPKWIEKIREIEDGNKENASPPVQEPMNITPINPETIRRRRGVPDADDEPFPEVDDSPRRS